MLFKNSQAVMDMLAPGDKVLDVGGWAHPFNRANFVMDREPFETRGYYNRTFAKNNPFPPLGGTVERFSKETWIERDICAREPYPFQDKELDFVVCSHTLEDIRDPLWVCSEMIRISKACYIEVPSRLSESCRGQEPEITGLSHHRWLIEIEAHNIRFFPKLHSIHRRRCSLPRSFLRSLSEEQRVTWLFWKGSFCYSEASIDAHDLERYVAEHHVYPFWLSKAEDLVGMTLERSTNLLQRVKRVAAL